jgi:hypothetical protein
MSYLVSDRDFLITYVSLELPDGCLLLLLHTPPAEEEVPVSGAPRPRTVRGNVGTSGWVLSPLPDGGVEATMLLQVSHALCGLLALVLLRQRCFISA